jgi:hypothetical protein
MKSVKKMAGKPTPKTGAKSVGKMTAGSTDSMNAGKAPMKTKKYGGSISKMTKKSKK